MRDAGLFKLPQHTAHALTVYGALRALRVINHQLFKLNGHHILLIQCITRVVIMIKAQN